MTDTNHQQNVSDAYDEGLKTGHENERGVWEDLIRDAAKRAGIDTAGIVGNAVLHTMVEKIERLKQGEVFPMTEQTLPVLLVENEHQAKVVQSAFRQFPIQGQPSGVPRHHWPARTIPWSLIAPHEARAKRNHDQDLETLARRGGLGYDEALWMLLDTDLRDRLHYEDAPTRLNDLIRPMTCVLLFPLPKDEQPEPAGEGKYADEWRYRGRTYTTEKGLSAAILAAFCKKRGGGKPICAHCGKKPAVCVGQYESMTEPALACGDCCGHGNEDGSCSFIEIPVPLSVGERRMLACDVTQTMRGTTVEPKHESLAPARITGIKAETTWDSYTLGPLWQQQYPDTPMPDFVVAVEATA